MLSRYANYLLRLESAWPLEDTLFDMVLHLYNNALNTNYNKDLKSF